MCNCTKTPYFKYRRACPCGHYDNYRACLHDIVQPPCAKCGKKLPRVSEIAKCRCGSDADVDETTVEGFVNVECPDTTCWTGPLKPTRAEAIEAWNALMAPASPMQSGDGWTQAMEHRVDARPAAVHVAFPTETPVRFTSRGETCGIGFVASILFAWAQRERLCHRNDTDALYALRHHLDSAVDPGGSGMPLLKPDEIGRAGDILEVVYGPLWGARKKALAAEKQREQREAFDPTFTDTQTPPGFVEAFRKTFSASGAKPAPRNMFAWPKPDSGILELWYRHFMESSQSPTVSASGTVPDEKLAPAYRQPDEHPEWVATFWNRNDSDIITDLVRLVREKGYDTLDKIAAGRPATPKPVSLNDVPPLASGDTLSVTAGGTFDDGSSVYAQRAADYAQRVEEWVRAFEKMGGHDTLKNKCATYTAPTYAPCFEMPDVLRRYNGTAPDIAWRPSPVRRWLARAAWFIAGAVALAGAWVAATGRVLP